MHKGWQNCSFSIPLPASAAFGDRWNVSKAWKSVRIPSLNCFDSLNKSKVRWTTSSVFQLLWLSCNGVTENFFCRSFSNTSRAQHHAAGEEKVVQRLLVLRSLSLSLSLYLANSAAEPTMTWSACLKGTCIFSFINNGNDYKTAGCWGMFGGCNFFSFSCVYFSFSSWLAPALQHFGSPCPNYYATHSCKKLCQIRPCPSKIRVEVTSITNHVRNGWGKQWDYIVCATRTHVEHKWGWCQLPIIRASRNTRQMAVGGTTNSSVRTKSVYR